MTWIRSRKGYHLQFSNDSSVAILTIRDFHNKVLRRDYGQYFKGEIREIFEEIEASGTKRLVLDLRNNQGGEIQKRLSVAPLYYE